MYLGAGMMHPMPGIEMPTELGETWCIVRPSLSMLGILSSLFSLQRDDSAGLWQVDVDMISVVFSSLVDYLELEGAYNIFILNPKHDAKRAKYGYR